MEIGSKEHFDNIDAWAEIYQDWVDNGSDFNFLEFLNTYYKPAIKI